MTADSLVTTLPDWPRAGGAPLGTATLKAGPEDFRVDEELSFEPSGDGPHDFLYVEKVGANTAWLASRLADHAGVRSRDVGYAGLKDRHARTRQWFSVPAVESRPVDWERFSAAGVRVLTATRNRRKLRRGAIARNRFRIRLRDVTAPPDALAARLTAVAERGVPNYFGEQRFGIGAANLTLATRLFAGARLRRREREFALSAARAWIFNAVLAARVEAGHWDRSVSGDILILDGRGSIFAMDEQDAALAGRIDAGELHPTGPLWGRGGPCPASAAGELERTIVAGQGFATGLEEAGLEMARRSLRLMPRDLEWHLEDGEMTLGFALPAGEYATTLMREILSCRIADQSRRNST